MTQVPAVPVVVTVAVVVPFWVLTLPIVQGFPVPTVKVTGCPDVALAVMVKLELVGRLAGGLNVMVFGFPKMTTLSTYIVAPRYCPPVPSYVPLTNRNLYHPSLGTVPVAVVQTWLRPLAYESIC